MRARILFVSDLHKRDCDFSTIHGYTRAVDEVQKDILNFIRTHGVTHLVSLGDWYDKGYRSINRSNHDRNFDEELSSAVSGNFYICLGNHFFLERDNNPEMYLIQPSKYYKPSQPIYATAPIIRAVPSLRIGPLQISFFHHSKKNKSYTFERDSDTTYHIGVYHDDVVIPSNIRKLCSDYGSTSICEQDSVFHNIDLAISGHIHTPLGLCKVYSCGRELPMIIPGALAITSAGKTVPHSSVQLPIVDVSDTGEVSFSLQTFSTHAELLKFYRRKEKPFKEILPDQSTVAIPKTVSLSEYLSAKGFQRPHLNLVDAASETYLEVKQGLQLLEIVGGTNDTSRA